MNFLILGGSGYLGSKITKNLLHNGHNIVCTKRQTSNLFRLKDVINQIDMIPASVDAVETVCKFINVDYVINAVCNYGRSSLLNDDVIEANINFPVKVLNTAVKHGIKKYLTIGTGLPDSFNMYSFSKRIFSELGRFYVEKYDITFNCLLLEMFYGADEPVDRFIPSVVRKMINGEDVETTIGTQFRDIISVRDVVTAVMMVIESSLKGYNQISVGTGVAPTVSQIIDFIWEETGRMSKIRKGVIPMREDEPDCVADTTLLKSLGSWEPISWRDGLRTMISELK